MEFQVRNYEARDREAVRWICCETGFMGEPVEAYFEGREVFADMWTLYWTDYEPESAFVAEVEGKVVGYLLGCLDSARQEEIFKREIQPRILKRAFVDGIFFKMKNLRYLYRVFRSSIRGEFNEPRKMMNTEYPAHLHTNIAPPEYRGKGIGKALMLSYLMYLRRHQVPGVHLVTTSRNKQALRLYYGFGFKDLFRGALTCYDHITDEKIEKIGLGLKL
jgi:GNAT superfamily N-acetyltransferase